MNMWFQLSLLHSVSYFLISIDHHLLWSQVLMLFHQTYRGLSHSSQMLQCLISLSILITILFDHRFWCCFIKHTEVSLIHPRCFSVLFLYQYWSPSCLITGFDVVSSNIQRFLSLIPDVDLFDSQDNSSWGLCNLCWWKNIQTSGASSAATEFSSVFTWKLMYLYLGRSIRSKLISHECQLLELSLLAIKIFFFLSATTG